MRWWALSGAVVVQACVPNFFADGVWAAQSEQSQLLARLQRVSAADPRPREHRAYESILQGHPYDGDEYIYGDRERLMHRRMVRHDGAAGPGLCIVSHSTLTMEPFSEMSTRNHRQYAAHHRYHYLLFHGPWVEPSLMDPQADPQEHAGRRYGLYWQKLVALREAMQLQNRDGSRLCAQLMWIDADAIFTDMQRSVEQAVGHWEDAHHLVIARQEAFPGPVTINSGVFLLRNNDPGRGFVDEVVALAPAYRGRAKWGEQDAVHHYIFGLDFAEQEGLSYADLAPRTRSGVLIVGAHAINSFHGHGAQHAEKAGFWRPGHYIAHFSGLPLTQRVLLMYRTLHQLARVE